MRRGSLYYDPWIDWQVAEREYGVRLVKMPENTGYEAITLAVAHKHFRSMNVNELLAMVKSTSMVFDIKHVLPRKVVDASL